MSEITYDEFSKVDIRVGRVIEVKDFLRARNSSYKVCVDFGEIGTRWSSAQLTNYPHDELLETLVVCVLNFAPRNIAGFMSEVLIMGAEDEDGNVILLKPRTAVSLGQRVF